MVKEVTQLLVAFGIIGGIVLAPTTFFNEKVNEPDLDLPVVGTYENLKKLVAESEKSNYRFGLSKSEMLITDTYNSVMESTNSSSDKVSDYSTTNVQVQGVDEGDIIKNDGRYLYHLTDNDLVISEIVPANEMKVLSRTKFDELNVCDLYIHENQVIVLGTYYKEVQRRFYGEDYTKALIFDASDKTDIKLLKEVEVSGSYNSSRLIEDNLYFVSNKYINSYMFDDYEYGVMPLYRDSIVNSDLMEVSCEDIRYFPENKCSNYMTTVGVNLKNLDRVADISTYLGYSNNIYSSKENMYITFEKYDSSNIANDVALREFVYTPSDAVTKVYRFRLEDGKMNCKATGEVQGRILNQFSMDENDGYFRIATTTGKTTGIGEMQSKNHLYVLNSELNQVGKIEDIAPGESIYSVRYMGDRAYMVTFRKVDPLFVIDLSNPKEPQILGKLKIPGYSDYLHPYDENHIIGFGKDAALVNNEDGSWGWADENNVAAYYQGMKIAMFDVTDPNNPIEMWKEEIGDRGTESELLNNHKALLFSKSKNLLAFPVRVATVEDKSSKAWSYGDTTFVGAYVYEITLDKGFVLKAKLTNLTDADWKRIGYYYSGNKAIDRLIYVDDVLYTISDFGYSAYDMNGEFEKLGSLEI